MSENNELLSDFKDYIYIVEKKDLIELNREFHYLDRFHPNIDSVDLSSILDKNRIVGIGGMVFDNVF